MGLGPAMCDAITDQKPRTCPDAWLANHVERAHSPPLPLFMSVELRESLEGITCPCCEGKKKAHDLAAGVAPEAASKAGREYGQARIGHKHVRSGQQRTLFHVDMEVEVELYDIECTRECCDWEGIANNGDSLGIHMSTANSMFTFTVRVMRDAMRGEATTLGWISLTTHTTHMCTSTLSGDAYAAGNVLHVSGLADIPRPCRPVQVHVLQRVRA